MKLRLLTEASTLVAVMLFGLVRLWYIYLLCANQLISADNMVLQIILLFVLEAGAALVILRTFRRNHISRWVADSTWIMIAIALSQAGACWAVVGPATTGDLYRAFGVTTLLSGLTAIVGLACWSGLLLQLCWRRLAR